MATQPQRLTVHGETYHFHAADSTAAEIAEHIKTVTAAHSKPREFFLAVRGLILRQTDNIEPEGAPRCDLVRDVFAEDAVKRRIVEEGGLTPDTPATTVVDLSYGQLLSFGRYEKGRMIYTPTQAKTLLTVAVWLAEGATIGRGYEIIDSSYRLPAEAVNVYRRPAIVLPLDTSAECREALRTLLRDGMGLREAFETATLL